MQKSTIPDVNMDMLSVCAGKELKFLFCRFQSVVVLANIFCNGRDRN